MKGRDARRAGLVTLVSASPLFCQFKKGHSPYLANPKLNYKAVLYRLLALVFNRKLPGKLLALTGRVENLTSVLGVSYLPLLLLACVSADLKIEAGVRNYSIPVHLESIHFLGVNRQGRHVEMPG